jgi:hypothetical protein
MAGRCGCGSEVTYTFHAFGCLECGAACCPACAVALESATYCRCCADSLFGVAVQPDGGFDLQ